jgi:tetrahydromethanopterin S-methyltransferase subunit F
LVRLAQVKTDGRLNGIAAGVVVVAVVVVVLTTERVNE